MILARLAALAAVVQAATIWTCSHWVWTPVQRHYLSTYLWCSLPIITPATAEVRPIWKTGPHRKRQLASETDAVSTDNEIGMALSQSPIDAGWTELTEGPPQRIPTAILRRGLADLAFDGESLSTFLLLPEACAIVAFWLALFGWLCLTSGLQALIAELAWRKRLSAWEEPSPSLFEMCAPLLRVLRSGVVKLHRSAALHIKTHPAATNANILHSELPARSPSFAFPLFGVQNGKAKGGYLWIEKDEIE